MDYRRKYIKYKSKYLESDLNTEKLKNNPHKQPVINNNNNMNKQYTLNVSEPWFTLISLGLKKVEGRKNKGVFKEMQVGDIIEWTNSDFKPRSVLTRITKKVQYNTFKEYLEAEGLDKCLPGMPDIEYGLSVYFKYFTKEDEKEFGVMAIHIELV